jgi:hypothetical protein
MKKFDASSMPGNTSLTVKTLRAFVENLMADEIKKVYEIYGEDTAAIVNDALRSVTTSIFHSNPEVHKIAKENPTAFDDAITTLFALEVKN